MRVLIPVSVLVAVATAACSGNPGDGRPRGDCTLTAADSAHLAGGPVYRDCHVDRVARLDRSSARIQIGSLTTGSGAPRCMEAEIEMVVGTDGRPEQGTWRLVRSTSPELGAALLASVPGWQFRPAELGGVPVRQIVRERQRIAIRAVAGGAAAPPTPRGC